MGPRADTDSGTEAKAPHAPEDDIDAGWDDPPLVAAPALRSEQEAPSSPAHEPLALVRLATPKPPPARQIESLSPSELEAPEALPRAGMGSKVVTGALVLGALAAAAAVWVRTSAPPAPAHVAASPPAALTVSEPAAPSLLAPVPVTEAAAPSEQGEQEPLVIEAPARKAGSHAPAATADNEGNVVEVSVKSIPDGAVFFEAGKRLGTSQVQVSVGHRAKLRLTALLDGYEPLNFKVDGTRESLTVRLTPAHAAAPNDDAARTSVAPASAPAAEGQAP